MTDTNTPTIPFAKAYSGGPAHATSAVTPTTDIEYVANSLWILRYGDMKIVAQEILGKDAKTEDVTNLCDKLYAFAERGKSKL